MNPATRLPFIDALKGIAILGVLFAHMEFSARFDAATLGHIRLLESFTAWCVLAFFFASGFLHARGADADLQTFLKRRAIRLLIPCAAFSWMNKLILLAAKVGGFLSPHAAPAPSTPVDFLAFILVPAAPQFYFLAHLFAIAVLVHALLRTRALTHPLAPWLLAAALLQSYWLLPLAGPHGEAPAKLPLYAAAYLCGLAFARFRSVENRGVNLHHAGMVIFTASIAAAVPASRVPLYALVPLAFALLAPLIPARILLPFAALGKKSGTIYVWHAPLIMTALSIALVKIPLGGWPLIAAMTVLAIASSLLLDTLVRRFDKRGIFRL